MIPVHLGTTEEVDMRYRRKFRSARRRYGRRRGFRPIRRFGRRRRLGRRGRRVLVIGQRM